MDGENSRAEQQRILAARDTEFVFGEGGVADQIQAELEMRAVGWERSWRRADAEREALQARVTELEADLADAEATLTELKPADVLVEGSWFPVEDLPKILGNHIRSAAEYARDAKEAWVQLEQVRRLHEVATQRCVELAAELLELKSGLAVRDDRMRAEGWDACAAAVGYDDGAPLVVASNVNPWREGGDER